jgi:hypothetical protein
MLGRSKYRLALNCEESAFFSVREILACFAVPLISTVWNCLSLLKAVPALGEPQRSAVLTAVFWEALIELFTYPDMEDCRAKVNVISQPTVSRPVCLSWCQAPIWGQRPNFAFF